MGCTQSREQTAGEAESGLTKISKNVTGAVEDHLFKPANELVQKVASAGIALKERNEKRVHHLHNVFVAPLRDLAGYKAPVFPKSSEEEKLLLKALKESFVFSALPDADLAVMVAAFEKKDITKGQTVIKEGDVGDYFYVLSKGTVRFEINGKDVGKASDGDSFGELALLYSCPRAASVISETDGEIFRVDQKTFRQILQKKESQTDKEQRELLRGVEFFKDLDTTDISKLAKIMKPRLFKKGEYLYQKGDKKEKAFYIVKEGIVEVKNISIGERKYEDVELGAGQYTGEYSLAKDEPRGSDCIAKTDGVAMMIDKESFQQAMGDFSKLILKSLEKRQLTVLKIFKETDLDSVDFSALAARMIEQRVSKNEVIVEKGKVTDAALFLVREGSVKITKHSGKADETIEVGGYFGDDLLMVDVTSKGWGDPVVTPNYTVTALETSRLGVLSLHECRNAFDTTQLGQGKTADSDLASARKIQKDDLTKHTILGAGTFGQVWLVSHQTKDGVRHPYALKVQLKHDLIETDQAEGVVNEKNIMQQLNYPFIMKLANTYQDPQRVYMLLGLIQGGELHGVMYERGHKNGIPEKEAKFYSAGLLDGLSYMHSRHIVHRDLKPENVMINENGYPVIIDFGFAKYVPDKTYTFCGTPLYIAPEILQNRGHDWGADHWSVGCMIYEMMSGRTPFYEDNMDQLTLFRGIVSGKFKFPRHGMSKHAKEIVQVFLKVDPSHRLGSLAGGLRDIYLHSWFGDIDFRQLREQAITPPWQPNIKDPLDSTNFSDWSHLEDKDKFKGKPLTSKQQEIFKSF